MFLECVGKYLKYVRLEVIDIPNSTGMNMTETIFTGLIQTTITRCANIYKKLCYKGCGN